MKGKQLGRLAVWILSAAIFITLLTGKLYALGRLQRLTEDTITKDDFRAQGMDEEMLAYIKQMKDPSESLGLYWLESNFGKDPFPYPYRERTFEKLYDKWHQQEEFEDYIHQCGAVYQAVEFFPVGVSESRKDATVSYVNSWMFNRDYGGTRGHEGTDIMADINERGLYPIVSMTDGVIRSLGWLEMGGYRIGIESAEGVYFYYAHLDSYANIKEGEQVRAGQLLGFMGDTGYGKKEGTKGKFPVHLHLGIYIYPDGREISLNPYWLLRYIEDEKVPYR